jgi:hypothetical protein
MGPMSPVAIVWNAEPPDQMLSEPILEEHFL